MSPAALVTSGAGDNATALGTLFRGVRFWIAQRLPSRSLFVEKVRQNGGEIVSLEKLADILIADHFRNDCPPNSISYTWIEKSIAEGVLQDKENHRAGPSADYVRPVGALHPAKTGRNPYTSEDDRVLYEWVTDHERKGGRVLGNEIYKQLEQQNARHPWQSWRDRWVKYVSRRAPPPSATDVANLESDPDVTSAEMSEPHEAREATARPSARTPEIARAAQHEETDTGRLDTKRDIAGAKSAKMPRVSDNSLPRLSHTRATIAVQPNRYNGDRRSGENNDNDPIEVEHVDTSAVESTNVEQYLHAVWRSQPRLYLIPQEHRLSILSVSEVPKPFTKDDFQMLLSARDDIEGIPISSYDRAWVALARENPDHTALEWKTFYEKEVLPQIERAIEEAGTADDFMQTNLSFNDGHGNGPHTPAQAPALIHGMDGDFGSSAAVQLRSSSTRQPNIQVASKNHVNFATANPVDTPSKQTLRAVVVPSISPEQRIEYTTFQPLAEVKQEPQSPNRKRNLHSTNLDNSRNSETQTFSKRQRLDAVSVESSRQASSALANALAPRSVSFKNIDVEVISIRDSDDEEGEHDHAEVVAETTNGKLTTQRPEFHVYESHEIPEGEEENVVLNEAGSPHFPRHHTRLRSEDALVVFGDPPTDFKLMPPEITSDEIWHDITVLETEQETFVDARSDIAGERLVLGERLNGEDRPVTRNEIPPDAQSITRHNENRENLLHSEIPRTLSPSGQESAGTQIREDGLYHSANTGVEDRVLGEHDVSIQEGSSLAPSNLYENYVELEEVSNEGSNIHDFPTVEPIAHDEIEEYQSTTYDNALSAPYSPLFVQDDEDDDVDDVEDAKDVENIEDAEDIEDHEDISRSPQPTDLEHLSSEVDGISADPDTPSKQLRAEMRETNLRYTSEPEEDQNSDLSRSASLHDVTPLAPTNIDTQALVDYGTIGDDYLDVPLPEDYDPDDEDEASSSQSLIDPPTASHMQNAATRDRTRVEAVPRNFIHPTTQSILEANTQPFVLDEYPQTNVEETQSQVQVDPVEDHDENVLPPRRNVNRSSLAPPSTPPRQMYYSDDSAHIPSSPPIIAANRSGPSPQVRAPSVSSVPRSGRAQSTASSAYAGMDPIDAFMARQQTLGSAEEDVTYALFRANWNSRLAGQVLDSMRRGRGLPEGVQGIWTEEEDEVILGGDARAMRMLEQKHGKTPYRQRVETMQQYSTLADSNEED